jgi:hypothetical protein
VYKIFLFACTISTFIGVPLGLCGTDNDAMPETEERCPLLTNVSWDDVRQKQIDDVGRKQIDDVIRKQIDDSLSKQIDGSEFLTKLSPCGTDNDAMSELRSIESTQKIQINSAMEHTCGYECIKKSYMNQRAGRIKNAMEELIRKNAMGELPRTDELRRKNAMEARTRYVEFMRSVIKIIEIAHAALSSQPENLRINSADSSKSKSTNDNCCLDVKHR